MEANSEMIMREEFSQLNTIIEERIDDLMPHGQKLMNDDPIPIEEVFKVSRKSTGKKKQTNDPKEAVSHNNKITWFSKKNLPNNKPLTSEIAEKVGHSREPNHKQPATDKIISEKREVLRFEEN